MSSNLKLYSKIKSIINEMLQQSSAVQDDNINVVDCHLSVYQCLSVIVRFYISGSFLLQLAFNRGLLWCCCLDDSNSIQPVKVLLQLFPKDHFSNQTLENWKSTIKNSSSHCCHFLQLSRIIPLFLMTDGQFPTTERLGHRLFGCSNKNWKQYVVKVVLIHNVHWWNKAWHCGKINTINFC